MAEGGSVYQDSVVCRYFLSGTCYEGDLCPFSHDPTRRVPDTACRYYLRGNCFFGFRCKYDHIILNDRDSLETNILLIYGRLFGVLSDGCPCVRTVVLNNSIPVPKHIRSYVDIIKARRNKVPGKRYPPEEVCPLFAEGECPFTYCQLLHGKVCELCKKAYLHPFNKEVSRSHIEKCKKEMEFSIAIERSLDKTCGICMDIVLKKEPESERRFGLLEKCNHIYCFSCIRQWWNSKPYESDDALDPVVTRACPQCRIVSDFVTPSLYFLDAGEEKQKFINEYKEALSNMPCKYFKQGDSTCPFGGACFYLHAMRDGTKVELPLPFGRSRQNQNDELDSIERIALEYGEEIPQLDTNLFSETDDGSSGISGSYYFSDYSENTQSQNGDVDSVERMYMDYRQDFLELLQDLISETDDDSSDTSESSYFSDYPQTMQNQNGDVDSVERIALEYGEEIPELGTNLFSETDDSSSDISESSYFSDYSETTQSQNGDIDPVERKYLDYRQEFSELLKDLISETDDDSSDTTDIL